MTLDPNRPRGLEALLGITPTSRHTSETDQLYDIATLLRITDFAKAEQVEVAVASRELLAVDSDGVRKYPSCQFRNGKVRTGIVEVLRAAPRATGQKMYEFLWQPNILMFGRRPIDLIFEAEDRILLVVREAQKQEG